MPPCASYEAVHAWISWSGLLVSDNSFGKEDSGRRHACYVYVKAERDVVWLAVRRMDEKPRLGLRSWE